MKRSVTLNSLVVKSFEHFTKNIEILQLGVLQQAEKSDQSDIQLFPLDLCTSHKPYKKPSVLCTSFSHCPVSSKILLIATN